MSAVLSWNIMVSKLHHKYKCHPRNNMMDIFCQPTEKISEKNKKIKQIKYFWQTLSTGLP